MEASPANDGQGVVQCLSVTVLSFFASLPKRVRYKELRNIKHRNATMVEVTKARTP